MIRLLLAGLFASGCYAKCWNVTRGDDHMLAECMDDDTQEPFNYYNYDMKPDNDTDTDYEYMADALYDQYAAYVPQKSNETSSDVSKRQDHGNNWSFCGLEISGTCLNTAFAGISALAAVGGAITAAIAASQQNSKIDTKPKTECYMRNKQQICVGYAVYYHNRMTSGELEKVGQECADNCAQQNQECKFDFKSENFVQTQCVTSKSVKCEGTDDVRACD